MKKKLVELPNINKIFSLKNIIFLAIFFLVISSLLISNVFARFTTDKPYTTSDARFLNWTVDVTDELSEQQNALNELKSHDASLSDQQKDLLSQFNNHTANKFVNQIIPKQSFKFTAKNNIDNKVCEALVKYDVVITLGSSSDTKALPEGVDVYINEDENDGENTRIVGQVSPSSPNVITFSNCPAKANTNVWQFQPAIQSQQTLYLFFSMNSNCAEERAVPNIKVEINYSQVS